MRCSGCGSTDAKLRVNMIYHPEDIADETSKSVWGLDWELIRPKTEDIFCANCGALITTREV